MGGEYNFFNPAWTTLGAIYQPITNRWRKMTPPSGWTTIGDAAALTLADGTFMLSNCCTKEDALLNAKTLTWTPTGSTGKADINNEEGWTLLPSGKVLTVDAFTGTNSELFDPATGSWSPAGSTIVSLVDQSSAEIGPAVFASRWHGNLFRCDRS